MWLNKTWKLRVRKSWFPLPKIFSISAGFSYIYKKILQCRAIKGNGDWKVIVTPTRITLQKNILLIWILNQEFLPLFVWLSILWRWAMARARGLASLTAVVSWMEAVSSWMIADGLLHGTMTSWFTLTSVPPLKWAELWQLACERRRWVHLSAAAAAI